MNLHGIIPPLVTPLRGRDDLDVGGLERLIEHVLEGGVQGLFILGTTGEGPSLSYRLRRDLIASTCRLAGGRVPVLVGITDTAFAESVALAHTAADGGAQGLVLAPPYYFRAGQAELLEYLRDILPLLPLPVMLYNMPDCTKVWLGLPTLRALADQEAILGIKDSSGDLQYFQQLLELKAIRPDWSVWIGSEPLLVEAVARGGDGGICGGANVFPRLFTQAYQAAVAGDADAVQAIQARILAFQAVYGIGRHASRFIKATKCALSLLGVCDDVMAEPFHRFRAPERERIRRLIDALAPPA